MVRERVFSAFKEALDLDGQVDTSSLVYRDFPKWTSMAHMTLISILEQDFDAMLETDDVLNMSNFEKAVEIMSKYAVAAA
jgi:acyl carrier protein